MGHNKIEKEFREKLGRREIAPSPQAWDRLDAMLSVSEVKEKPVRRIKWVYYAAAASAVILFVTILLNVNDKNSAGPTQVVVAPSQTDDRELPDAEQMHKVIPQTVISIGTNRQDNPRKAVAEIDAVSNKNVQPAQNRPPIESELAVASSPQTEDTNTDYNPEPEVEQLLATVGTAPPVPAGQVKVDAGSLLSQVDHELELTFREKVIRSVSKNYNNVKVALANRNQE